MSILRTISDTVLAQVSGAVLVATTTTSISNWILATGAWLDDGVWLDDAIWID
jgi:hypothetical protein